MKDIRILSDGSTIRICETCRVSPLCVVREWPIKDGVMDIVHAQNGDPLGVSANSADRGILIALVSGLPS